MTRVCSRCKAEKDLSEFHKRADRAIGVQSHCKECQKARKDQYLLTPEGSQKAREFRKDYYSQNKEFLLDLNRKWREENHEYRKEYLTDYERTSRKRDKTLMSLYHKRSRLKALSTNPMFRINQSMSVSMKRGLVNGKQGWHWEGLAGFTCKDLAKRLKKTLPSGYSWDDYVTGKTDLEIDHIIPIAAFNYKRVDDIDFRRCWALTNLRLIPKSVNCSKRDRIERPFQPSLQMAVNSQ